MANDYAQIMKKCAVIIFIQSYQDKPGEARREDIGVVILVTILAFYYSFRKDKARSYWQLKPCGLNVDSVGDHFAKGSILTAPRVSFKVNCLLLIEIDQGDSICTNQKCSPRLEHFNRVSMTIHLVALISFKPRDHVSVFEIR